MTRTFGIICLLLYVHAFYGYGQEEKKQKSASKDSYESFRSKGLSSNAEDLLKDADELKNKNPDQALAKVKEALGLSLAQGDAINEARCYQLIGEINEGIVEWNLALENYNRAHEILKKSYPSSQDYKTALRGLGASHLKLGNYQQALQYFQELLSMRLHSQERKEYVLDLSEVYYQMTNYSDALKQLDNLPPTKIADPTFETRVQNQRAKIYARTNDIEKTRSNYDNSLNTLRTNKAVDKAGEQSFQTTKEEIADALLDQKRYDDEIDLRNQSVQFNLEAKNLEEVTKDKVAISKTLAAKGENTAALREIEEAVRIADTLNNPREQANAFLVLADLYEKNGKNSQALTAYKKYSTAVAEVEKLNESELQQRSGLIIQQRDIEELTKNVSIGRQEYTIERAIVFRQQLIIYGLTLILLITATTSYFIYKNAKASKVANQLLALKSLRSQMNPHFIFNALNSVNHFIAQQDERTANKFLSEFSQLMRLVMENSQEDFIPLNKEQEILSLYLKLEHYRFRDKFEYEIKIDESINPESIEVPPMLIQPYIENAVWHGLRYKETMGKLSLHFLKEDSHLVVHIIDDGIGRKRSAELKTANQKKHNSTGIRNIQERLAIINKVYTSNYRVHIEDAELGSGTHVSIHFPVSR
ncbi:MAG TPA: histidine kinase [Chryseolinea sp.]|nr:histidine kinase [Chryseolinea sp.]